MAKRGDFSVKPADVERIVAKIANYPIKANQILERRVRRATDMVFSVATQRRPYISKKQVKLEGRAYPVSDPSAKAGVPVAYNKGGKLQASIKKDFRWEGKKAVGSVYTDLGYAKYVEFGTPKMAARPFLRSAMLLTQGAIQRLFGEEEKK